MARADAPRSGASRIIAERFRAETASASGQIGRRLVEQHDRDVVAHGIAKLAVVAEQRGVLLTVLERALALGAHEDGEQLGERLMRRDRRGGDSRSAAARCRSCASWEEPSPTSRDRRRRQRTFRSWLRAARPMSRIRWPPAPIRMRFWLSRSTYRTVRMYSGALPSRNSSTTQARLYGTSSSSCSRAVSRTSSATKKRTDAVLISSSG